ncbi:MULTISPECIES: hypothetical protein [Bacillaceae]|uniref:Uncharacterized protein n=1 Tax=Bacillus salipaludis TaxID=2547811 RepID=A0AA90QYS4_9BACI|nr:MULTISPECIES: hypothetical protein [Bacillaceae]MBI0579318.1 hypothetical protein [Neobacillus cucumis]MDQ6596120.1 hypothetical protein [Bacillus salipaludis]MED1467247.1 hypothetical protein [Bacillus salipaludis]
MNAKKMVQIVVGSNVLLLFVLVCLPIFLVDPDSNVIQAFLNSIQGE